MRSEFHGVLQPGQGAEANGPSAAAGPLSAFRPPISDERFQSAVVTYLVRAALRQAVKSIGVEPARRPRHA